MTISFKRISQKFTVLFALALVAATTMLSTLPVRRAFAANTITQPLVWTSADHANLVDSKDKVFVPLGWACPSAGGTATIKGSGADLSINGDVKPTDKTVSVPADTEAQSGANKIDVPKCPSDYAANYVWATQFSSGTNFVLWTAGHVNGQNVDAQHKPIAPGQNSYAELDSINGDGTLKKIAQIKEIKVDASKAGVVDKGKASNSDNTTPTDTCKIIDWQLRWLACPMLAAANTAISKLEDFVTSLLANDVKGIFGTSNNPCKSAGDASCAYYTTWNTFRTLAVAFIIIIAIIMVVSEATGMAIFDAYTIRKILPRLLIAVIFIAISWWVMRFIVQFFNNISAWTGSLLSYPFHTVIANAAKAKSESSNLPWSIVGQWGVIIGLAVALGPALLSYALTAFLALIVAALTLVVRRILIVLAIMTAPIFIACYIMPNTQKMAHFWRDLFIGLLLMGPVFTATVTTGQVVSAVSQDSADKFGFIPFACLVIPVLAIPVLFTKIGGSTAALIGFANDKSKGGFDRLKNYRTNERQRRVQRAKEGNLFGAGFVRGKAADKLNTFTSKAGMGVRGQFGMGEKGKEAYEQRMGMLAGQHAKSDAGQAAQFNDDLLRAQRYGSAAAARRNMASDFDMYVKDENDPSKYKLDENGNKIVDTARVDKAIKAANANGGFGKARQIYAAKQLAVTGTGYDNAQQMIETIAEVAGNNSSLGAAILGEARSASKRAGRQDLGAAGYGDLNGVLQQQIKANNGLRGEDGESLRPTADDYRGLAVKAFRGSDMATLVRDKTTSVKNISSALYSELNSVHAKAQAAASPAEREKYEAQAAALTEQIKNFQQTAGIYAPAGNSQAIHNAIVAPDRGNYNRTTQQYEGPNVIQQVSRQSAPSQPQTQVVYQRQVNDRGETTGYVQQTQTTPAPPSATPHMQQAAEPFRSQRGPRDLDDPNMREE